MIVGTNKFASQKGMSMGAVRHVADIRADDMDQEGQGLVSLQSGKLHCSKIYTQLLGPIMQ